MRITEGQLRRIIREEARRVISESSTGNEWLPMTGMDDPGLSSDAVSLSKILGADPDDLYVLNSEDAADFTTAMSQFVSSGRRGKNSLGTFMGSPALMRSYGGSQEIVVAGLPAGEASVDPVQSSTRVPSMKEFDAIYNKHLNRQGAGPNLFDFEEAGFDMRKLRQDPEFKAKYTIFSQGRGMIPGVRLKRR